MDKQKRILIVDDEKLVVTALQGKLEEAGFAVDSAFDGEEALAKIQIAKPDLVLLDIIMPKLDGISVLKQLKQSPQTKDIPIIILTNLYDDEKITEVLETGETDYLIKVDYTIAEIIARIKEKLHM